MPTLGPLLPEHAESLLNEARRLDRLGQVDEALAAAREATAIHRTLAGQDPGRHRARLVCSLNLETDLLLCVGQDDAAADVGNEAETGARELARDRPDLLAQALHNSARIHRAAGKLDRALKLVQEAADCYRRGLPKDQLAFADCLNTVYEVLMCLGRKAEARTAAEEGLEVSSRACQTSRQAAGDHPDAHLPDVALALRAMAIDLDKLARQQEALARRTEAIEIYRRLIRAGRDELLPVLGYYIQGELLPAVRRLRGAGAAKAFALEAVHAFELLADRKPDRYLPDLARALFDIATADSGTLRWLFRARERAGDLQRAVEIWRRLSEDQPGEYLGRLSLALTLLGAETGSLGRTNDALRAYREGISIRRNLLSEAEGSRRAGFVGMLTLHARLPFVPADERVRAAREAVEISKDVSDHRPGNRSLVVRSMEALGYALVADGRRREGLDVTREAAELCHPTADGQPVPSARVDVRTMTHLGARLLVHGRLEGVQALGRAARLVGPPGPIGSTRFFATLVAPIVMEEALNLLRAHETIWPVWAAILACVSRLR